MNYITQCLQQLQQFFDIGCLSPVLQDLQLKHEISLDELVHHEMIQLIASLLPVQVLRCSHMHNGKKYFIVTIVYMRMHPEANPKTRHIQSGIPGLLFCKDFIGIHKAAVIFSLNSYRVNIKEHIS